MFGEGGGGGGGGKGDARVNDFFFWGGGTRVSDFFTKNPNLKKRDFIFLCLGVGGGRGE